jgi:hypothetical protein
MARSPNLRPEVLVGVVVHLLVAEEDHLVLGQGLVHFLELAVAQRLAQVDAEDLRADPAGHRLHVEYVVGHEAAPSKR